MEKINNDEKKVNELLKGVQKCPISKGALVIIGLVLTLNREIDNIYNPVGMSGRLKIIRDLRGKLNEIAENGV